MYARASRAPNASEIRRKSAIGGKLAQRGSRLFQSIADKLAGKFFNTFAVVAETEKQDTIGAQFAILRRIAEQTIPLRPANDPVVKVFRNPRRTRL